MSELKARSISGSSILASSEYENPISVLTTSVKRVEDSVPLIESASTLRRSAMRSSSARFTFSSPGIPSAD
ncbi:hypothetical protein KPSA1_04294 [Pseudomonas syringae pv. actinidiae]|uniref:Uncharacterized protein n=1 Tax=Pseudomonas syringae pv. actinidiae TaxID=103796 RepID=A0A2V0QDQ9_PSESF|nr:hypothetical protein KPSA1_04294 [Pseudomonas syringae pv. actinidiae]